MHLLLQHFDFVHELLPVGVDNVQEVTLEPYHFFLSVLVVILDGADLFGITLGVALELVELGSDALESVVEFAYVVDVLVGE